MWTFLTVLLCGMLGNAVAGRCGVSAPEVALSEIFGYCDDISKSRTAECTAAMHRFCGSVTYPNKMVTFGVPREASGNRIRMSCVKTYWKGDVSITALQRYEPGCTMAGSRSKECIRAIHKYCAQHVGLFYQAGLSQEAGHNVLGVHCFKPSLLELVSWVEVKRLAPDCQYPDIASAACFAGAARWCNGKQYSGGIPQSWYTNDMTIACYNDEFEKAIFVKRKIDTTNLENHFYVSKNKIDKVCNYRETRGSGTTKYLVLDYISDLGAEKTIQLPIDK